MQQNKIVNVVLVSYIENNSPCGVRVYYEILQKHLPAYGIHIELVTPSKCSGLTRYITGGISRLLIKARFIRGSNRILLNNIVYWIRIRSALKNLKTRPDLIHAQDPGSASAAAIFFKGKIPVLTTCHFNEDLTEEALLQCGLVGARAHALRKWHAWTFKHTHWWIAVSSYAAEKLRKHVSKNAVIRVIYNGVDFDGISATISKFDLHNKYPGKVLIINVGTLEPRKNQRRLLDVAEHLGNTPAIFFLVGDGPDRVIIENEIQRRHLYDSVKLLGYRKDVIDIMKGMDIYCHFALKEVFGLAVAEAVAARIPVVTVGSGGTAEIVGTVSESCFPVDADIQQIGQRISELIFSSSYREDLARRQHEFALQRCSISNMIKETMLLYEETLKI